MDPALAVLGQDSNRLAVVLAVPDMRAQGITTAAELRAWVDGEHLDWLEIGCQTIRFMAQTGIRDWFHWANANRGTKWTNNRGTRTHEPGSGEVTLSFQTAWDAPSPVLRALARRPEVEELALDVLAVEGCACFAPRARIDARNFTDQEVELTPKLFEAGQSRTPGGG